MKMVNIDTGNIKECLQKISAVIQILNDDNTDKSQISTISLIVTYTEEENENTQAIINTKKEEFLKSIIKVITNI